MLIETDRLVSQSTYATMINKSRQWVSQMIKEEKIEYIRIDGTPYIIIDKPKNKSNNT